MPPVIVGFGEALVDILPSAEVVGGAPLNFSLRVAQLGQSIGVQAAMISRIGADLHGEQILALLQSSALDTRSIQVDSAKQTGYVNVALENGQPSYVIGEDVAWDCIAFDSAAEDLSRSASAICFGTLAQRASGSRETLLACLNAADNAKKIFDINLRKPYPSLAIIEESLHQAHVLKCNAEELVLLSDWLRLPVPVSQDKPVSCERIADEIQSRYDLDCIFWTRGADGCTMQQRQEIFLANVPRLPAQPDADSVGAGDAAAAALAIGLVANWPPKKIVAVANYCGAWAASQPGATTPFPPSLLDELIRS